MNFNVYLNNDLAFKMDNYVKAKGISRSKAVREALLALLESKNNEDWSTNFFDFTPVKDFPDVTELRENLKESMSDPLI